MIDLSLLPPSDVVEPLDFESLFAARKARLLELTPEEDRVALAAALELESEPIAILLQESAYRELVLRQRINDAARAVMLSSAQGADLDHLAALYGVARLVTDPGDADALPPIAPTYETDAALRHRTQLAVDGFSTAGPAESYRFHALSASGEVVDAAVASPTPGQVVVTVLGDEGDGTPAAALLDTVAAALNAETVRPLTDEVLVQAATVIPYAIVAELVLYPGPAPAPVLAAAQAAVERYTLETHCLGYDVTRSGLYAALHRPGVQRVALAAPAADVVCAPHEAPHCSAITITVAEATDV